MISDHISYAPGELRILDQTLLPQRTEYETVRQWPQVVDAIRGMKVRGAPAIGIVGAYGMALAAHNAAERGLSGEQLHSELESASRLLSAARPTAVNLSWAILRACERVRSARAHSLTAFEIEKALTALAKQIHADDVAACRRIGDSGAGLLPADSQVLTHCNTGDLATGGYGTALGIIRSAWRAGKIKRVFVGETRPLLQGARLTAWELQRDAIPYTLITDSMAAYFMRQAAISAVIVGADRIARNGDVANKIGTYGLAVLARAHNIPFIVAAPLSTFDKNTQTGGDIAIEERSAQEVIRFGGAGTAPEGAQSANPAFDVTPAEYISAIVTEAGIVHPPLSQSIAALLDRCPGAGGPLGERLAPGIDEHPAPGIDEHPAPGIDEHPAPSSELSRQAG